MKDGEVKKLCQICEKCSSKYKCPSCYLLYCSLECFKSHKGQLCETETNKRLLKLQSNQPKEFKIKEKCENDNSDDSEDEDRLSPSDLDKLGKCDITKGMLKNKHLRTILASIDNAQDPPTSLNYAMSEPIFTEFVDQCLSIVDSKEGRGGL